MYTYRHIQVSAAEPRSPCRRARTSALHKRGGATPNLPAKNLPAKSCRLRLSGEFPVDTGVPPPQNSDHA